MSLASALGTTASASGLQAVPRAGRGFPPGTKCRSQKKGARIMQIEGKPKAQSKPQVESAQQSAPPAAADKAGGAGMAAGSQSGVRSDNYQLARPQASSVQNAGFAKIEVGGAGSKDGRMSCCLPPPKPEIIGFNPTTMMARVKAALAEVTYETTIDIALKDH